MTGSILAKHGGRCPGCNAAIVKSEDLIEEVDGRWYHVECVPHEVVKAREAEVEPGSPAEAGGAW